MSEAANPLPKPKVRFSKTPDSNAGPFQGPKIREVITLKTPVRLITPPSPKTLSSDIDEVVIVAEKRAPEKPMPTPKGPLPPKTSHSTQQEPKSQRINSQSVEKPTLKKHVTGVTWSTSRGSQKSSDVEVLQKQLEELKTSDKTSTSASKKSRDLKSPRNSKQPEMRAKIREKTTPKIGEKSDKNSAKLILRPSNTKEIKPAKISESSKLPEKLPKSRIRNKENVKKSEMTCAQKSTIVAQKTEICEISKPARKGGKTLGLMPCLKKKNVEKKNTKVDVMRNVGRPIPQVLVGPGNCRVKVPEGGEQRRTYDLEDHGDVLKRPEYNSIVCTIRKMEEVKKKKVVENLESLPGIYKDLVNGKVSSALDFPPCESLYHDLVDLSIDEQQLPMRLTRTKDPEPRPKDFIPKLSDFFTPQYQKEYAVPLKIKARTAEIMDNWSGFGISNKINSWKISLDEPS